jgi:hypothetical protein
VMTRRTRTHTDLCATEALPTASATPTSASALTLSILACAYQLKDPRSRSLLPTRTTSRKSMHAQSFGRCAPACRSHPWANVWHHRHDAAGAYDTHCAVEAADTHSERRRPWHQTLASFLVVICLRSFLSARSHTAFHHCPCLPVSCVCPSSPSPLARTDDGPQAPWLDGVPIACRPLAPAWHAYIS